MPKFRDRFSRRGFCSQSAHSTMGVGRMRTHLRSLLAGTGLSLRKRRRRGFLCFGWLSWRKEDHQHIMFYDHSFDSKETKRTAWPRRQPHCSDHSPAGVFTNWKAVSCRDLSQEFTHLTTFQVGGNSSSRRGLFSQTGEPAESRGGVFSLPLSSIAVGSVDPFALRLTRKTREFTIPRRTEM